jgi:GT2 family glycosyltransferase
MIENEYSCWIIIVHYNGAEWIEKCLGSFSKTNFEDKIIVVDNFSTEQDGLQIIQDKFPKITLIKLDENVGFGRANNVGIALAIEKKAKYIFLLNQDAWLCEIDTIEKLVHIANDNLDFAILSPVHYNSTQTALDQGFAAYITNSKNVELSSNIFYKNNKNIYEIPFVNAAAWLLNVECFKKIGFFDPDFFMYGEDTDMINRVLFHKLKLGVTPFADICHAREYRSTSFPTTHLTFSEKTQHYGRYLSVLKNINDPFFTSILKFIVESLKNVSKEISLKLWNRAFQITKIILKLIIKIPKIFIKRRQFQKGIPNK